MNVAVYKDLNIEFVTKNYFTDASGMILYAMAIEHVRATCRVPGWTSNANRLCLFLFIDVYISFVLYCIVYFSN